MPPGLASNGVFDTVIFPSREALSADARLSIQTNHRWIEAYTSDDKLVVPSLVRLQPLNRCPLALAKAFDCRPLSSGQAPPTLGGGWLFVDRESRISKGTLWKGLPFGLTDVELKDEMVESSTDTVQTVTENEGKSPVQRLNLSDVEAIFQSFTMTFGPNGPRLAVHTAVHFIFEYAEMTHGPGEAIDRISKAPISHWGVTYAATEDDA